MGDMFRSEEMVLCQIFIQSIQVAYDTVSELGETGTVQFRDLNSNLNGYERKFVKEIRLCDEVERKIRFIEAFIEKAGIKLPAIGDIIPRAPSFKDIRDIEESLEKTENEVNLLTQNDEILRSKLSNLKQHRRVLEVANNFFNNADDHGSDVDMFENQQNFSQLESIAGVIGGNKLFSFERMLWRITRGKVFIHTDLNYPIRNLQDCNDIPKYVFLVMFQGKELKTRIQKLCAGFHAKTYHCPKWTQIRVKFLQELSININDLVAVLYQNEAHSRSVIGGVLNILPSWKIMIKKVKAISFTLNMFNNDISQNCLVGEFWTATKDLPIVKQALEDGRQKDDSTFASFLNFLKTDEVPPTCNRTNKFTKGFQMLIDAYGVASYREANPALYTIITFPFLFAVMFGDLGHGFILFLFAAWMCMWEAKLDKVDGGEIWTIFIGGRYIILLMGVFSTYTGFIYNDVFSKSMNIFGSTWTINFNSSTVLTNPSLQLNPTFNEKVYPMGLDPIWELAQNQIIFTNTFKMKLSIIFGVIHMFFGICMSVVNFNHFRKRVSIVLEFLPQILLLTLLFGYMVFMMFFKWVRYSAKSDTQIHTPGCAPSVLILFINMMLFGHTKPLDGCQEFMFNGQHALQVLFVSIAIICIPWMLLGKPLYVFWKRKNDAERTQRTVVCSPDMNEQTCTDSHHVDVDVDDEEHPLLNSFETVERTREEEPMSEIFIHQAIHTIEFVLSTVSHTASYLRLWALSLAHAQLSKVLWSMVLSLGLTTKIPFGSVLLFFIFGAWSMFTLAILVMMEGLSAFLHTLRLHWVEFMSKFYAGLGHGFKPFSFKAILEDD